MNRSYSQQLLLMFKRLSLAYLLYFVARLIFFLVNRESFEQVTWWQFAGDAFFGLRFDSFSIAASNSLFILLSALPLKYFWSAGYQKFLRWLFFVTNAVFSAFDFIDAAYFPFIRKRSTSDILYQMGGQTDMGKMLPRFAADYWWLLLLFICSVAGLVFMYAGRRIHEHENENSRVFGKKWSRWVAFVLVAACTTIAIRGGLQRVPIDLVNAGSVTRPGEAPLVLNSSFSIIKSMSQQALPELHFYPEEELAAIYSPVHKGSGKAMEKKNVVVLILESFSKEYTGLGKRQSVTPFLDSLMGHSLVFTNGYSNGTRSIEGIPAILSGLPSLMKNPFINSLYANNHQSSIASLLKQQGYHSAFFHGGINGTMNFNDWAALAGYDEYHGKNEYGNDADFDGYWGILDEPFLQYACNKMTAFKEPFHTAIFTLSSHHPYFIPEKYKGRFPKGRLENAESIGYADYSLRKFFETAARQKWYNNTLFVLVADHTGISEDPFYTRVDGLGTIPIVFFAPGDNLKGTHEKSFSQMDILPSIMEYLHYPDDYFAFGDAYQQQVSANDYLYFGDTYFLFNDSAMTILGTEEVKQVFNYRRDSLLNVDLRDQMPAYSAEQMKKHKAFVQVYNDAMIRNAMLLKN